MTDQDPIPDLQTLMAEFVRSGLMTLHLRHNNFEILLSNDPDVGSVSRNTVSAVAPVPKAPPQGGASTSAAPAGVKPRSSIADLPSHAIIIRAPNLGTFYRAPKPGAEDYVQIGSAVTSGQELCLIEVMKLFTAVRSDQAGRVHAVLADDGAMVEAGQPLFALVAD